MERGIYIPFVKGDSIFVIKFTSALLKLFYGVLYNISNQ